MKFTCDEAEDVQYFALNQFLRDQVCKLTEIILFERISPFFDFLDYFQKILLYILYFVPVNFLLALVYGLLLRNFALLLTAVSHLFLTLVLYYFLANTKKYFFFRLLHTFLFLLAIGQLRVIF